MNQHSKTPFLHAPVQDSDTLQKYVRVKEWETEQLDFKMKLDSNREEDAKDIAALANRLGGDLVIGITEKDDRAEAFHLMEDSRSSSC